MQQTTTPSTQSICTPSSFEQQQPSNQILIQEQEASSGKAPKEQNGNTNKTQPQQYTKTDPEKKVNHQKAEGDLDSLDPRPLT